VKIEEIHTEPTILSLKGDPLGEPDAILLKGKISKLVKDGVKWVVLDLQGVRHINSAGLGGLISAMITLRNAGGDARFASPSKNVEHIFAVTKLTQIFETHQTVEEARVSFGR
jgi:anti-sigma B factor antagonist